MFYFPFVELIQRALNWAKSFSGILYWIWVFVIAIFGALTLIIWQDFGWANASIFAKILGLFYIVTIYPLYCYDKKWHKRQKMNKDNK